MTEGFTLRELEGLFHRAVALAPAEREQFLDRADIRTVLRAQVEHLIEADAAAQAIFDGPLQLENATADGNGRSIGRWNLLERIGSGGLGVVFRASCESDGVTLQAAVKILHPGLNVLLQECFIQERRILAGLDHPYVARLIDAGAGACGTSFLAVEYVDGLPLDTFFEQRRPPFDARLELFVRICDAAAYLHEQGIVHGDLKPSNVMVKADGTPKLLDFGTARLIENGTDTCDSFTRLMMTPSYASPEQIAGLGPSAAGDVYSLGCMLREILGNEPPCADLVAVRDQCLAFSANQRYESACQLAEDVGRYRKQLPVRARPATPFYVMTKFIRRNRIACSLGSLAAVAVLVGGLGSRHQAMRAQQYLDQHRAVVARLVVDEPVQRAPESQQRAAYAAGLVDVIAQMEGLQSPPRADLTSAWRRLSYSQAARGQTAESIASIERSIRWARQYLERSATADAAGQLAESLLYATLLQTRRGEMVQPGPLALEGVRLVDTLPQSRRTALERTPQFVRALPPAARQAVRTGDIEGARALLLRAIERGRTMGASAQLRATLDLVAFERASGDEDQVAPTCAAATSLGIATERLARLCGTSAESSTADRAAGVAQRSAHLERRLQVDPERYGYRLQLAKRKLQMARQASGKNEPARAREWVQQARALVEDLLSADPENRNLRQLLSRIKRVSRRIGAG